MPFMSDADYNSIICTAQKTNPATPANKNVVTMAVIVEKAGGILESGIRESQLARQALDSAPRRWNTTISDR